MSRPEHRRAGLGGLLAFVMLLAATLTGCDGAEFGLDTDPCTGSVLYRSAEGCACDRSGDAWARETLWRGHCLYID